MSNPRIFSQQNPPTQSRPGLRLGRVLSIGLWSGFLVWSMIAFGLRGFDALRQAALPPLTPAMLWRIDSSQIEEWAQFFGAVEQRVPLGSTIIVDAPGADPADEFFLSLWAAYYLPRHEVVRRVNLGPGEDQPRYRITAKGAASLLRHKRDPAHEKRSVEGEPTTERILLQGPGLLALHLEALSSPQKGDRPAESGVGTVEEIR